MSGPIEIKERLMQSVGAGECTSRPLTEEEKHKFDNIKPQKRARFIPMESEIEEIFEMEDLSMNPKIVAPEKEELIETLSQVQGKAKALRHAAKEYSVSNTTVLNWTKRLGIEFDVYGKVVVENKDPVVLGIDKEGFYTTSEPKAESKEEKPETDSAKDKPKSKLGYAEHDIGNAILQIDFRDKLVNISKSGEESIAVEGPITFEEAIGVAEMILEVLAGE